MRRHAGSVDVVVTHWPPTLHALHPMYADVGTTECSPTTQASGSPTAGQRRCAPAPGGRSARAIEVGLKATRDAPQGTDATDALLLRAGMRR